MYTFQIKVLICLIAGIIVVVILIVVLIVVNHLACRPDKDRCFWGSPYNPTSPWWELTGYQGKGNTGEWHSQFKIIFPFDVNTFRYTWIYIYIYMNNWNFKMSNLWELSLKYTFYTVQLHTKILSYIQLILIFLPLHNLRQWKVPIFISFIAVW